MNPIDTLAELFMRFPGIGPRQARRFVYYLLKQKRSYVQEFASALQNLSGTINECAYCHQFFYSTNRETKLCKICSNPHRDRTLLLVVEKDTDLEASEKSDAYTGLYFVLGGTIPLMSENPERLIRMSELKQRIKKGRAADGLSEVILGLSLTPEGENTSDYIERKVREFEGLTISHLGRGLSTGTELEYIDTTTFKNALENRQ